MLDNSISTRVCQEFCEKMYFHHKKNDSSNLKPSVETFSFILPFGERFCRLRVGIMTKVREVVNSAMTKELSKNTCLGSGWRPTSWLSTCPSHVLAVRRWLFSGGVSLSSRGADQQSSRKLSLGLPCYWWLLHCRLLHFFYTVFSHCRWHMGCFTGSSFSKGGWEIGLGHLFAVREVEWRVPMPRWTHKLPFCLLSTEEIEVGNSCPLLVFMICYYFSGSGKHTDLSLKLYHEIRSLRNLGALCYHAWEEIVQVTNNLLLLVL